MGREKGRSPGEPDLLSRRCDFVDGCPILLEMVLVGLAPVNIVGANRHPARLWPTPVEHRLSPIGPGIGGYLESECLPGH